MHWCPVKNHLTFPKCYYIYFFNIIAPLGLGLVIYHKFYKYYRGSAAQFKLQRSKYICSQQISVSTIKLQHSDNISNKINSVFLDINVKK